MINNELISVIIPLYNNDKYIEQCILSILNQTYKNFEIIIVNDGSTDNSLNVCNKYISNKKITIFTKTNGGLSLARNYGLSNCNKNAKYVVFVDSDDFIEPNYLEELYKKRTDLTICNIKNVYYNLKNTRLETNTVVRPQVFENFNFNLEFAEFLSTGLFNSACNKLYSTLIITKHKLKFRDIEIAEDLDFNIRYLRYCSKIRFINEPLYNYVHYNGTLTSHVSEQQYNNYLSIHQNLLNFFDIKLHKYVDRFVYHQYLSISLRFIKEGNIKIVRQYLSEKLIIQSIKHYKCSCFGDFLLYILFRYKFVYIIKLLFTK